MISLTGQKRDILAPALLLAADDGLRRPFGHGKIPLWGELESGPPHHRMWLMPIAVSYGLPIFKVIAGPPSTWGSAFCRKVCCRVPSRPSCAMEQGHTAQPAFLLPADQRAESLTRCGMIAFVTMLVIGRLPAGRIAVKDKWRTSVTPRFALGCLSEATTQTMMHARRGKSRIAARGDP